MLVITLRFTVFRLHFNTEVSTAGEFSNIMHNPVPQTITLDKAVKARFIKLDAKTTTDQPATVSANEIGVTVE